MTEVHSDEASDADIERGLLSGPAATWELIGSIARASLDWPLDDWANLPLRVEFSQVHSALYDINAVVGRFDWPRWHGEERYPAGAGLETAPIADVARFITCIARADRFVDGLLDSYVASGVLARLIDRLATWYQANTTP